MQTMTDTDMLALVERDSRRAMKATLANQELTGLSQEAYDATQEAARTVRAALAADIDSRVIADAVERGEQAGRASWQIARVKVFHLA